MVSWHRVIILSPMYIIYQNSEIGNSDSDFRTRNHNFFPTIFRRNFAESRNRKRKFRFRTPQQGVQFQRKTQPRLHWHFLKTVKSCCNLIPPDYISWNKWLQQGCTVATVGQVVKNMVRQKDMTIFFLLFVSINSYLLKPMH